MQTGNAHILNIYSLTPLEIKPENTGTPLREDVSPSRLQLIEDGNPAITQRNIDETNSRETYPIGDNTEIQVVFTTNILHSIDDAKPSVENIVSIHNDNSDDGVNGQVRMVNVWRKTAPPLNIKREQHGE